MAEDQNQSSKREQKPLPSNRKSIPEPSNAVSERKHTAKFIRKLAESIIALIAIILVLMWLAGTFHSKVNPAQIKSPERTVPEGGTVFETRLYSLPQYEWAVGTIQAVHETALGSKILARVMSTTVKAGQKVIEGQVLMKLDEADLLARVEQAKATLDANRARLEQAQIDYNRIMKLAREKVAAEQEINLADSTLKAAQANVALSQHALEEARTTLGYATIKAPFTGLVIDKKVEVGDTVVPGQILLKLYDPTHMQLVANVRESLAIDLKIGQPLQAYIPAMHKICCGTVAEIVPQAQAASRTFDVKVVGPCAPDVYTGMFGRLLIPRGEEQILLIPQAAVSYVGQLNLVDVIENQKLQKRSIQTGRTFEDFIEVLSGLSPKEKIWIPKKLTIPKKTRFLPTYLWQGAPVNEICPASAPAK